MGSRASPAASCLRELIPSLEYVWLRWVSIVLVVTNSAWAISCVVRPSAASSATRSSLGVRASGPVAYSRLGLAPVAASSARARSASRMAPAVGGEIEPVAQWPAGGGPVAAATLSGAGADQGAGVL